MTGTTLQRLRKQLGITQAKLADWMATTPNTVARMERDEMPIRPPTARLVLLLVHLAEQRDDYVEELVRLGGRKRR